MVFTQIDNDLDGTTKKIGILGKGLSDITSATRKDGIGGLKDLFKSPFSSNDLQAIEQYNSLLAEGKGMGEAFNLTLKNTSKATQNAAISAKGAAVSQSALTTATKTSTLATIGLQAATMALNMLLSLGLSIAVQAVVSGLNALINAKRNAAEAAQDMANKSKEEADKMNQEAEQIDSLIAKYKELASKDRLDMSDRTEVRNIQEQITTLVGEQSGNLDLVNGKLNTQLAILEKISAEEAKKALEANQVAYASAKKAENSAISENSHFGTEYAFRGKLTSESVQEIINAGFKRYFDIPDYGETSMIRYKSFYGGTGEDNGEIAGARERVAYLEELMAIAKKTEGISSDFYLALNDEWKYFSNIVAETDAALNGVLKKIPEVAKNEDTRLSNITGDSVANLEEYKSILSEIFSKDESIKNALSSGDITNADIDSYLNDYISQVFGDSSAFDDWYSQYVDGIEIGIKRIKDAFKSNNVSEEGSKFSGALKKNFDSWIDNLSDEEKEIVYDISLTTETAQYSLADWKFALEDYEAAANSVAENTKQSFEDLLGDDSEGGFSETIDTYVADIEALDKAIEDLNKGNLKGSAVIDLINQFPQLAGKTDDLKSAIHELGGTLKTDITSYLNDQFGELETEEDIAKLQAYMNMVLSLSDVVGNTYFSINFEAEAEGMQALFTAMKESVSSTGLTSASIENLKERFKDLRNYDPSTLFEHTANGIHLNTTALRELESAYEKQQKLKVDSQLEVLVDEYNRLTDEINGTSSASKQAELYAQRDKINAQIDDVSILATQYAGLTSAFYKWEQAQSIGEEGDMYDSLAGGLENIKKLYDEGLVGTNKFRTAVQLMSNEDLSTANIDELIAAYEAGYGTMTRYFQDGSDGALNFLNDLQGLNSEWVSMNDDGSWNIDFGIGGDQEIADALGISVESVQAIMRKLSDYGFDINLDSAYTSIENLSERAETAATKLKELGKTDVDFNFNTHDLEEANSQIEKAQTLLDQFKAEDGTVDLTLEGAEEAQTVLIGLISQKQQLSAPSVLSVDVSQADTDVASIITKLQEFQLNYNNFEIDTAVGADTTEAKNSMDALLLDLQGADADILASLNIDATSIETLQGSIANLTPEMMVTAGLDSSLIDEYDPEDEESTVKYNVDSTAVDKYAAPPKTGTVTYSAYMNGWTPPTKYGTVVYNAKSGSAKAQGTAHARGTAFAHGTAFSQGNWGTTDSGTALVGEENPEILVLRCHLI